MLEYYTNGTTQNTIRSTRRSVDRERKKKKKEEGVGGLRGRLMLDLYLWTLHFAIVLASAIQTVEVGCQRIKILQSAIWPTLAGFIVYLVATAPLTRFDFHLKGCPRRDLRTIGMLRVELFRLQSWFFTWQRDPFSLLLFTSVR